MRAAQFEMVTVCGHCHWQSRRPKQACNDCGCVICAKCGMHCMQVALWPGEDEAGLAARFNRQLVAIRERVAAGEGLDAMGGMNHGMH